LTLTEPEFASHSPSFVVCIPFCLLVEMCCSYFFALLAVKALDVSVLLFRRELHFFLDFNINRRSLLVWTW
jgi:hypothetical protein